MADDRRGRPHQEESQYPPPPGEEDDRRPYPLPPPQMATGVTLPSINDPYGPGVSRYPPPPDPRSDPRSRGNYSTSPQSVNGYAAPPPANSGNGWNLPPLGAPADQRASYGADGRDYYGQRQQYPPTAYPPSHDYRQPPPNHGYPGYQGDYRGQPQQQQAAPRQRTSIACRYCRKRKIRCSGYQNTPDGKCTNCKKTGNDCVFQPVSSSTSTAFIPVSAVPGGVPPGTPLYGAFGQPLAPAATGAGGPPQGPYPPPGNDYALPSPTSSGGYYGHPDDRAPTGTRRPRAPDDEGMRLPPPSQYPDEDPRDPRRRSPVSMASNTPPTSYHQYPRADEYDDRTPTPRRNSPGGSNVMALGNLVDHQPPRGSANNIDQNMLGRLNRRS